MTRQRNDEHSTEYGMWLRAQKELDSVKEKFNISNIDYVINRYGKDNGQWMFVEEKRHGKKMKFPQTEIVKIIDAAIKDVNYRGFWHIIFENTNPDDGLMFLSRWNGIAFPDGMQITKEEHLKFLRYELDENQLKAITAGRPNYADFCMDLIPKTPKPETPVVDDSDLIGGI